MEAVPTKEADKNLWDHVVQRHDGFLYRYEETCHGSGDVSYVAVYLYKYRVIRQTAKGAWIRVWNRDKFVLFDSHKKFACLTKEEALESYEARRRKQVKILKAQLQKAERALRIIQDPEVRKSLLDEEPFHASLV